MSTPDWNKLAKLDLRACCELRSERYIGHLREMWKEIVNDEHRDNNEIKSIWLKSCEGNHLIKQEFLAFILESREDNEYRAIDWKDVLRFFHKMSIKEELEAEELKTQHYKY